ncbi:MAG: hypothetical protein PHV74_10375 [Dehalococcoidia bacterium]|nr:hypothetical protein [Dehalococcoidia bacterium]
MAQELHPELGNRIRIMLDLLGEEEDGTRLSEPELGIDFIVAGGSWSIGPTLEVWKSPEIARKGVFWRRGGIVYAS